MGSANRRRADVLIGNLPSKFNAIMTPHTAERPLWSRTNTLYAPIIIKICGDIANGSKHFRRNLQQNTSVQTHSAPPPFAQGFQPNAFQTEWSVWVELNPSEAQAVGIPEQCRVLALAEKALEHWRRTLQNFP
jgi:hypothetical protein